MWSTSATALPRRSASRATTTRRRSSRTRVRRRVSAASFATSSRWAPGRSRSWIHCGSGRSTMPRSRWIAEGVVSGISGYGNSVGVPTVGGEIVFDETYAENPLVNVLCLGVMPAERLVLGRATGVGNLAVLLGSSTGRDGIGGVSVLASAGFGDGEADAAKRPSVQVGDPFEEKRLIEACLALLDAGLAVGVQDLGGAGLTCATSETAAKGGAGHGRLPVRGASSRARHGAVRGDDERVPGAHARHRPTAGPRRGARHLRAVGGAGVRDRHRHRHRPAADPRARSTATCWPTSRRSPSRTTRPATTAPVRARRLPTLRRADEPAAPWRPFPPNIGRARGCWSCWRTPRGCRRSTTTSCS